MNKQEPTLRELLTPKTPKDWDQWTFERQLGYDLAWRDIQEQAIPKVTSDANQRVIEELRGLCVRSNYRFADGGQPVIFVQKLHDRLAELNQDGDSHD